MLRTSSYDMTCNILIMTTLHINQQTHDVEINVFASEPLSRKYIESRSLWNDITYHTVRGFESCLIYTWIAKDLCWTLYSPDPIWEIFAGTALGFGVLVMLRSVIDFELEDAWHRIAEFLWVFANFLWMSADIHDFYETNEEEITSVRYPQAAHILEATMCWLAIYYLFIKPSGIKLSATSESSQMYDGTGLVPRFAYFENWRQYENVHIVWWIGKDYAWLTENQVMWVIFVIPTVLISIDFVICTGRTKRLMIDHCYYISQLLWVLANITWAYGELYLPEELDEPRSPWVYDKYTKASMRWYSCWLLIFAYLPLVFLLCCWLPLMVWAYQSKDGRGVYISSYVQSL